ncbi:hypothetical protein PG994_005807 [Apiospora phragmitis]|uniref:Uncharacterized protein n=1 Tax=Apiospora phragmitis TaxID=2905665 RepID=A0ABR1VD98_9PEZI
MGITTATVLASVYWLSETSIQYLPHPDIVGFLLHLGLLLELDGIRVFYQDSAMAPGERSENITSRN